MGGYGEQRDMLENSNRIADQLIEQGLGIQSKLTSQGDIMKVYLCYIRLIYILFCLLDFIYLKYVDVE